MNQNSSATKIKPFIDEYELNTQEFEDDITSFKNFNEFFFRKLRDESRPVSQDAEDIVFPADGRHF